MCHKLEDWEHAEEIATPYTQKQIGQFSPRSRAILEIQSWRDLEILEKIYANSVLLGDDSLDGWGIRYAQGDFNMTSDSKLFPPRPQWEAQGYRPDEYSRWLKGDWRPIEALWAELDVDPSCPSPADIKLEDWLFDTSAGPERREAEARFVYGHLLKPGDVTRTDWRLRCAQSPYDRLPIPRADIPEGVVLSREGDAWIREDWVGEVALPLLQGAMIWHFDPFASEYAGGSGHSVRWTKIDWNEKYMQPQYLLQQEDVSQRVNNGSPWEWRLAYRYLGNVTNERTLIAAPVRGVGCGHTIGVLTQRRDESPESMCALFDSLILDWVARQRLSGSGGVTALDPSKIVELPVPHPRSIPKAIPMIANRISHSSMSAPDVWLTKLQPCPPDTY